MPAALSPMVAIIDRDRMTAYGLALLMRDWGYESVVGVSAPDIFGRTEAAGRPLAAIVADDRADDAGEIGTTGYAEAAALAQLAQRAIPTVVLVAVADPAGQVASMAPGFIPVPKPVEPIRLRDLLRSLITIEA